MYVASYFELLGFLHYRLIYFLPARNLTTLAFNCMNKWISLGDCEQIICTFGFSMDIMHCVWNIFPAIKSAGISSSTASPFCTKCELVSRKRLLTGRWIELFKYGLTHLLSVAKTGSNYFLYHVKGLCCNALHLAILIFQIFAQRKMTNWPHPVINLQLQKHSFPQKWVVTYRFFKIILKFIRCIHSVLIIIYTSSRAIRSWSAR